MKKTDSKKRWLAGLVVVEIIICYMAVLTVISYQRGPVRHQVIRETPLLDAAAFTSFTGEQANGEEGLSFTKGNEEGSIGYNAHLQLSGLSGIYVAFSVDCPAEYAGNMLHIDLQESSVGYDNDEQEFFLTLEEGINQVEFTLDPGDSPPDTALLRFFTLDAANYIVQDIQIYPEAVLPKIPMGMLPVTGLCFVLLLVTGLYFVFQFKKGDTIRNMAKTPVRVKIEGTGQGYRKEDRPTLSMKREPVEAKRDGHMSPQLSMPEWKVEGVKGWLINPLLQRVADLLKPLLEQQSAKNSQYLERFGQLDEENRKMGQQLEIARQLLDAQQAFLEQLKEQLDAARSQEQYHSETLADQSFHLAQVKEKLVMLQNQSQYCVETLGDHSFRLKQAEEKLETVQNQGAYNSETLGDHGFRLKQAEEKLETVQNQGAYNSETLGDQSFRLAQAEKKLETVQNQGAYNSETLGDHSFRLVQAEEKLDALQNQGQYCSDTLSSSNYRLNQSEEKLEAVQNQNQFNSEVLADHNFRLEAVERRSEKLQYQVFSNPNREPGAAPGSGYFSQSGEDMIIEYILERLQISPSKITYLDLGANHAVYLSNTNYFYQHGARGVLVEANPNLIPELKLQRKGDTILHRCISEESGNIEKFYILNKDGLSSPDLSSVEECMRRDPGLTIEKVIDVETISVNDIFGRYFEKAPTIVNMDIEGKELEILNGLDFKTYRPLVFVIETIPYRTKLQTGEKQNAILEFMKTAGYVEYAFTGINSIFVDAMAFQPD
jgi:FkbM family methyltransferase